jgi:hypothetical protein
VPFREETEWVASEEWAVSVIWVAEWAAAVLNVPVGNLGDEELLR